MAKETTEHWINELLILFYCMLFFRKWRGIKQLLKKVQITILQLILIPQSCVYVQDIILLIVKLSVQKYQSCKSFPKYKTLISFQLLENLIAWNLTLLFFCLVSQEGLIDMFVICLFKHTTFLMNILFWFLRRLFRVTKGSFLVASWYFFSPWQICMLPWMPCCKCPALVSAQSFLISSGDPSSVQCTSYNYKQVWQSWGSSGENTMRSSSSSCEYGMSVGKMISTCFAR